MKRPQFSLRTIFIAIAMLSIPMGWVAYQLNWIRQRHVFLDKGFDHSGDVAGPFRFYKCPWSLSLFGEQARNSLYVDKSRENEAKELFPEAIIATIDNSMPVETQ